MTKLKQNKLPELVTASQHAYQKWIAAQHELSTAQAEATGDRPTRAKALILNGESVESAMQIAASQDDRLDACELQAELAHEAFQLSLPALAEMLSTERVHRNEDALSLTEDAYERWPARDEFDAQLSKRLFPLSATYEEAVKPIWNNAGAVPLLTLNDHLPAEFEIARAGQLRADAAMKTSEPLLHAPSYGGRIVIHKPGDWKQFFDAIEVAYQ